MYDSHGNFSDATPANNLTRKISRRGMQLLELLFDGDSESTFDKYYPLRVRVPGSYRSSTQELEFTSFENVIDYLRDSYGYERGETFTIAVPGAIRDDRTGERLDAVVAANYFDDYYGHNLVWLGGGFYDQVGFDLTNFALTGDEDLETIAALATDITSMIHGYLEFLDTETEELKSTWIRDQFDSWLYSDLQREIQKHSETIAEAWSDLDYEQAFQLMYATVESTEVYPEIGHDDDSVYFDSQGSHDYTDFIRTLTVNTAQHSNLITLIKGVAA